MPKHSEKADTSQPRGFRCRGCRAYRELVLPEHASCKSSQGDGPLCKLIDVALLHRRPRLLLAEYQNAQRAVEAGYVRAQAQARDVSASQNAGDFIVSTLEFHHRVFGGSLLTSPYAGRFRKGDENAIVDLRAHAFTGVDSRDIEKSMTALYESHVRSFPLEGDPQRVASWGAVFLRRFFKIHPFVDGNGRVARWVLGQYAARARMQLRQNRPTGPEQRRYVQALRYAHRYSNADERAERPWVDPHRPLARWLARHLEVLEDGWEVVGEPPEWLR